ncbi:MAG: altronate dehydratase family protein [Chloroflexota bacterium]|nr:MAG: galactonate dehydratase [Chloroflexota bacterium]
MSLSNVSWVDIPSSGRVALDQVAIRLHPVDEVAIAKTPLQAGTVLESSSSDAVTIRQFIPAGHKIALRALAAGEPVRRYGQVIGFTTAAIAPGEHIHSHNLGVADFERDYAFGVDVTPVAVVAESERRTFNGYLRPDGRVGTRNMIAVISTVNCSAHTSREIARAFTDEILAEYPNVDGVVALAHQSGCGNRIGGEDYALLQRTLAGMAVHANVGAYILVGLGCETNQIADLIRNYSLDAGNGLKPPPSLNIQDEGGIRKTVQAGVGAIRELLPEVNRVARSPQPVSELIVALQCGGSDGWSGVTANPALGLAVDELVRQGGTGVLAETPEIYGAEHLLTRRAISEAVGQKLVEKVRWWEDHARKHRMEIDNNPSVGNKVGGLTTIFEKSLGAVAKGGNTPLTAVYDYAERITERGLVFMDSPGYDPVSATGQVAGGSNLIVFTTGRGSVFGFKPVPSIKVATNSEMYRRMEDDMDLNAGEVLEGKTLEAVASELFELMIRVASGEQTKSEAQGVGESEFNPWNLGGTL